MMVTLKAKWEASCLAPSGYITSGLVLNLYAICNAGVNKPHNSDTLTWTDLSGNDNTGTIQTIKVEKYVDPEDGKIKDRYVNADTTAPSWQNNSVFLDAVTKKNFFAIKNPKNIPTGASNYTIEVAYKCIVPTDTSTISSAQGLFNIGIYSETGRGNAYRTAGYCQNFDTYYWSADLVASTTSYADLGMTAVNTNRGSNRRIYAKGNLLASDTTAVNSILGDVTVGKTVGTELFNGYIYSVRVYRSALTDAQLLQNYNVEKARFGF